MKVLCCRRWYDDLDVVFGGLDVKNRSSRPLQCSGPAPSNPCGNNMVSPLRSSPFVFGAANELVDDHLGRVEKITKLSFPNHQTYRARRGCSRNQNREQPASLSGLLIMSTGA